MYKISLENYINKIELQKILSYQDMAILFFEKQIIINLDGTFGIGSSTYRVFKKLKHQPSKIFKIWASNFIINEDFKQKILLCKNKNDFEDIYKDIGSDLFNFWLEKQEQKLLIAHKNKLLDLFFKYLTQVDLGNININQILLKYIHVPLDSKTLPIINNLLNGIFLNEKFSMGNIKTIEAYNYIQELVYTIMNTNNSYPIYLDYYANNHNNQKK